MKRKVVAAVILALALGGGWWLYARQAGSNAQASDSLRLSGHIETTQTDLSFKVAGKLATVKVQEGDQVAPGQVVAELEDQDLRQEVAVAAARLAAAQANLKKLKTGSRPQELMDAKAAVAQARADLTDRQRDLKRQQDLLARGATPRANLDKAQLAADLAREALRRAEEKQSLTKEGFRSEDVEAGQAEVELARATLELAKTKHGYATLISPVGGVVLVRDAEPGEVAAVGAPIVTLGDLDGIWLEVYLPETELAKVRLGQEIPVTTDSYPDKKLTGRLVYVAAKAEFTPKTVETAKERVTLVFRSKIKLDNPEHRLRPGQPGEAFIPLNHPAR